MTRRARELETLALTALAAAPLYVTEGVGLASLVAFHVVLGLIFIRVAAGRGSELVPTWLMRFFAIAYVPFYVIDIASISRSAISASTHLLLFISAYQPMESMRKNNQAQRLLTAALLFVASLATSTHISVTLYVIVFAFLMLRQLMYVAHLETASSLDRTYAEAPSGRAATFYLAGSSMIAIALFPFLPRVRNPMVQGFAGGLPGASTALSDTVNFNEPRVSSSDATVVARVWMNQQTIPFFTPLRLRGTIYDRIVVGEWRQTTYGRRPLNPRPDGSYVFARPGGVVRDATVQMRPMGGRLFVPVGTFAISGLSNLAEGPTRDAYHVFQMRGGEVVDFNASMATRTEPLRVTRVRPLNYPIRPEIAAMARQIAGNAQTVEARAARIESYLSTRFTYVADPSTLPRMSVEQFLLREHRGHCEYFAAGMVVLLTSLDVPARMVGGFYGGRLNPLTGYFIVRREDAHAWVEVWDGSKWTTFDPTPAALRPGNAAQGLLRIYASALGDSVNYFWDRYVLTFGLADQITLFADTITRVRDAAMSLRNGMASGVRSLRSQAFAVLMALVVASGLIAILIARRRRPLFDLLATHLARLGIHVGAAMTMEEALRELREQHPDRAIDLEPLVRLYEEEEFSANRDSARRRELRRRLAELVS